MTTTIYKRKTLRTGGVRYQRPVKLSPWASKVASGQNGSVWISMTPRKILDQFSKGAGTIAVQDVNTDFLFLAPLNLNENIVHHWEAYESVASRLAQKVRSAVKLGSEVRGMANVFGSEANLADAVKNTFSSATADEGTSIEQYVNKVYKAVPGTRIPPIKVDTPLYYTNSDRRQIVFEFQLFNESVPNTQPEDILIKPVQELMKYSSPDLKGDINIEFPYMWSIETYPKAFIKYTTCALVGVQPTWNSPYVNGLPSSVNLQLTFMDMSPLYAGTIESGSIVRIISKEESESFKAYGRTTTAPVLTQGKTADLKQGRGGL
jgi:hypothetical protein